MKVAHFANFAPYISGQFATVIDFIKAERMQGINAQLIDFASKENYVSRVGLDYEGVKTIEPKWSYDADILIRHSFIPFEIDELKKPTIMMLHGRPEGSFLLDIYGINPVYTFVSKNNTYKAFLVFLKEVVFNWSLIIDSSKLFYVPAPVDLTKFLPEGQTFSFQTNQPNILCVDAWREDVTPYNVLLAAVKFVKEFGGKIHIFGVPFNSKIKSLLLDSLQAKGFIGEIFPLIDNISDVYRSADMVITPHIVATRVIRESLACGLPIIAGGKNNFTSYYANPRNIDEFATEIGRCWQDSKNGELRKECRRIAEKEFSLEKTGKEMKAILELIYGNNK